MFHSNLRAKNYIGEFAGSIINERFKDAIVTIYAKYGSSSWMGSGSFVYMGGSYGYLLTAAHVVTGTEERTPKVDVLWLNIHNMNNTGENRMIKVTTGIYVDNIADVAIVRVPEITSSHNHLRFGDYSSVDTGDIAYIFGNPLGADGQSISMGNVRDSGYVDPYGWLLMKNLVISTPGLPGNSGSPILNKEGLLIGLFSWGITGIETIGGGTNGGILSKICDKLVELGGDYVTKRFLGIAWISVPTLFRYSSFSSSLPNNSYNSGGLFLFSPLPTSPFYGKLVYGNILLSMTIGGKKWSFTDNEATTPSEIVHLLTSNEVINVEYATSLGGDIRNMSISLNTDYSIVNSSSDIFIGGYSTKTLNLFGETEVAKYCFQVEK